MNNATDPIISLNGLSVFKENYDSEIDEKISKTSGKTYTLTKNSDGEIVLSCSDGSSTKVDDSNTTYSFEENNHVLTITGSDGTTKDITLGGKITKAAIIEALGFTPMEETELATVATSGDYEDLSNKPEIPSIEGLALETEVEKISKTQPTDDSKIWLELL